MLRVGVLEQFGQLQRVLADLLHWREQEAVQRDVDHLLQQSARLEEKYVLVGLHQLGELKAGVGVVVAVLGVDLEICLLRIKCKQKKKKQQKKWENVSNSYIM